MASDLIDWISRLDAAALLTMLYCRIDGVAASLCDFPNLSHVSLVDLDEVDKLKSVAMLVRAWSEQREGAEHMLVPASALLAGVLLLKKNHQVYNCVLYAVFRGFNPRSAGLIARLHTALGFLQSFYHLTAIRQTAPSYLWLVRMWFCGRFGRGEAGISLVCQVEQAWHKPEAAIKSCFVSHYIDAHTSQDFFTQSALPSASGGTDGKCKCLPPVAEILKCSGSSASCFFARRCELM